MRRSLLAVLLLAFAATCYAGADNADDADDSPVLALFDGNGTRIGPVVSYGFADGVVLTINGAALFVPVTRVQRPGVAPNPMNFSSTQLQWREANGVYYGAANCAGQSYIGAIDAFYNVYAPTRPSIPVRAGGNVTLYIAADTVSASTPVASFFATVLNRCESFAASPVEVWPSASTFDLTGHYPEPLSAHY